MKQETDIQKLLQKFVENNCNEKEIETIIAYVKQVKGTEDFPNFDEVLQQFEEIPDIEQKKAQEMYFNILKTAKRHKSAVKTRTIWRYAAAAILVVALASTYFLRDSIFNNKIENTTPVIVNNKIETGTDKATLTLETGETIALVKGASIQTQNATSNGEAIIYDNSSDGTSDKIAYNYLTIPRGGQFQLTLADGTKVWLNSESKLKYPVNFIAGESRQVELVYGEAYFEVSPSTAHKGADFKVINNQQEVQVLGTQFNIKAYKDETHIYTTLVEGKVAVNTPNNKTILKPGEQSNLNIASKTIQVGEADIFREVAWKNGVFSFKGKTLKEIMVVLARWYDMEVVFENKDIEQERFIGTLYKHQSIIDIMESIKSTKLIKNYQIHGNRVVLE